MESDPAKKQYFVLSLVISMLLSFVLNFFFAGLLDVAFISGFPLNVVEATGIADLVARFVNTVVMGALLAVPMYYFLFWLQDKGFGRL